MRGIKELELPWVYHAPKQNFYKITPTNLKENSSLMTSSYSVNQLFKTIINQIEMAVDFFNAIKVPYTPKQVAKTVFNLIFSTGYFTNSCHRWNVFSTADKNWENLKPFFANEHRTL